MIGFLFFVLSGIMHINRCNADVKTSNSLKPSTRGKKRKKRACRSKETINQKGRKRRGGGGEEREKKNKNKKKK